MHVNRIEEFDGNSVMLIGAWGPRLPGCCQVVPRVLLLWLSADDMKKAALDDKRVAASRLNIATGVNTALPKIVLPFMHGREFTKVTQASLMAGRRSTRLVHTQARHI